MNTDNMTTMTRETPTNPSNIIAPPPPLMEETLILAVSAPYSLA